MTSGVRSLPTEAVRLNIKQTDRCIRTTDVTGASNHSLHLERDTTSSSTNEQYCLFASPRLKECRSAGEVVINRIDAAPFITRINFHADMRIDTIKYG